MTEPTINCLIPARMGSKRIPMKNIRILGGKPLIAYSIQTAIECGFKPIVSSDSPKILDIAQQYGSIPLKRWPSLSRDNTGDYPVLNHFWQTYPSDLTILLRPTTPFRKKEVILQAISLFKLQPKITSLRSIEAMSESAYKAFWLYERSILRACYGSFHNANRPDQLNRPTYKGNGYVDIVKGKQVFTRELWGKICFGFRTPPVIELDSEEDWIKAEQYLLINNPKGIGYPHIQQNHQ